MKSLKVNKEIKSSERFLSEHVLTMLSTPEKHNVKEVIKCLEDRYGKTRIEKLEELIVDLMRFKVEDYEEEGNFLHAMEEIHRRKKEMNVIDEKWHAVWMLKSSEE